MLVLSRKVGEKIQIGNDIVVMVTAIAGDRVRLGISGPPQVPIHREEIYRRVQGEEQGRINPVASRGAPGGASGARSGAQLCESTQSRGLANVVAAPLFARVGPALADVPNALYQG